MKQVPVGILVALALAAPVPAAHAAVDVLRGSQENPVVEIFRATIYGAAAGAVVGGAIMLIDGSDSTEPLRWGTVIGTFAGLASGIYFVAARPPATALLEFRGGELRAHALPTLEVDDGVRVHLVGLGF